MNEHELIARAVLMASVYFREPLTDEQLTLYTSELSDLGAVKVIDAYRKVMRDPEVTRLPLPSKIRATIESYVKSDDQAVLIATDIVGALAKFGAYNAPEARVYLGEIAWEAIKKRGGWGAICNEATNDNLGVIQAQLKGVIIALLAQKKATTQQKQIT